MSGPDPVMSEAVRWLQYSEEDVNVALRLLTDRPSVRATPFVLAI